MHVFMVYACETPIFVFTFHAFLICFHSLELQLKMKLFIFFVCFFSLICASALFSCIHYFIFFMFALDELLLINITNNRTKTYLWVHYFYTLITERWIFLLVFLRSTTLLTPLHVLSSFYILNMNYFFIIWMSLFMRTSSNIIHTTLTLSSF